MKKMKRKRRPKTATTLNRASVPLRSLVLACLAFFLTTSIPLQSREPVKPADYALIFGTVWGPDDRPVQGVKIKIRMAQENKARWEVYSNRLGEFEQRVPAGKQDYVIWADLKGFKSAVYQHLQPSPEVTVHIESDERTDTGVHLK
jgi:hypothetical protein